MCEKKYNNTKIILLDENEENTTFHLTCDKCATSILVFVSGEQMGFVSLGMATDMDSNEVKKFFKNDSVSLDDVISVHEHLQTEKVSINDFIA